MRHTCICFQVIKMDSTILENTKQFAKVSVTFRVMKKVNEDAATSLKPTMIYVAEDTQTPEKDPWRAILIDSQCQGGKTNKCFELLNTKIQKHNGETLVLFVTQANSTVSVNQVIQRATNSAIIQKIIPSNHIMRSNEVPDIESLESGNYMVTDFWNSRTMSNILDFVKETKDIWRNIVIVIDEVEQAGLKGVKDRLAFIRKVEKAVPSTIIKVIFVTATVANLRNASLLLRKVMLSSIRQALFKLS